jgi:methylaspartate ammonia-lyase
VWVHKFTWKEFRSRTATSWQVCDASTVTEVDSNLVVFVQNGYDTREIRNQHMAILNIRMARLTHAILVNADKLAIQGEVMQAIVATVTDHHEWLGSARIDPDAVWLAKLSISTTTAAPRSYQVTLDVELMNPV